ncbi:MAG: hypothetical protein HC819_11195 [Cyclobacteriaceae bacterium]|nr:hypothetical protein [Cyclobacteriaceae bacterium]
METYLIYIVKVIALQTILFGFYWVISRKSSGFHFNRFFLLAILILPVFIPLLKLPFTLFYTPLSSEGAFDPWFLIEQSLPSVVISGGQIAAAQVGFWTIFALALYLAVAVPLALRFMYDYYKIYQLGKTCTKKEYTPHGYRLLYVHTKILSFSFLNKIFLSHLFPLKPHEKKTIVTHEEYHLTQRHSIDIIISELVRILCWFNPVILLIQKDLKETHEYLADRHTIVKYGRNDYTQLLRSFKWQEMNMLLGSGYSSASIKNRLKMIEKASQRISIFKTMALSLLAMLTAFLFACENELDSFDKKDQGFQYEFSEADLTEEMQDNISILTREKAPQHMIDRYVAEQTKQPQYLYMPSVALIPGTPDDVWTPERFKKGLQAGVLEVEIIFFEELEPGEAVDGISYLNDDNEHESAIYKRYALIQKVDRLQYMEYKYKSRGADNSVHDDYDKAAQFKGGMQALAEHLRKNLNYPAMAKTMRIEDKLTMRFVVSKHGGLVYLNVDKAPQTLNEDVSIAFQKAAYAALRETEGMWEPAEKDGKYVMSKMILPIEFTLNNK